MSLRSPAQPLSLEYLNRNRNRNRNRDRNRDRNHNHNRNRRGAFLGNNNRNSVNRNNTRRNNRMRNNVNSNNVTRNNRMHSNLNQNILNQNNLNQSNLIQNNLIQNNLIQNNTFQNNLSQNDLNQNQTQVQSHNQNNTNGQHHTQRLVLLSLSKAPDFDQRYASLLAELRLEATLLEATSLDMLEEHTSTPGFSGVIVTDATILTGGGDAAGDGEVRQINNYLVDLVTLAPGTNIVFGFDCARCLLANTNNAALFRAYMRSKWGLEWRLSPMTTAARGGGGGEGVEFELHEPALEHIPWRNDRLGIYRLRGAAQIHGADEGDWFVVPRHPLPTAEDDEEGECPVVYVSVGQGFLGFVGDVAGSEHTGEIYAAMCFVD
jgi:hypothetical protein